jgi:hypothetical protein
MQGEDGFAFSRKSDSIGLNQTRRLSWLSMIYMARAETQGCAAFPGSIYRQRNWQGRLGLRDLAAPDQDRQASRRRATINFSQGAK